MFLELIAVVFAGFAGAGLMMLVVKFTPLPRWLVPIGAGVAMIATTISNEYTWYARTTSSLPDGLTVAQSVPTTSWWRPWTYAAPITNRFVAIDTDHLRENQETEDLYLAELYFFGRWRTVTQVQVMVDCVDHRRADPTFGDNSEPVWREAGPEDPIVKTVCGAV